MNQTKQNLRRRLKASRTSLSLNERTSYSQQICHHLDGLNISGFAKNVHIYEPIANLLEVDISQFMAELKMAKLRLFTSRKVGDSWRLMELGSEAPISEQAIEFDAIIVPMLGFDNNLARLGYGSGYYDRLLAQQPRAKKIGVCFSSGKLDHLPLESHDVAMDQIVTENGLFAPSI